MKIYILCVLYNKKISEIVSIDNFLQCVDKHGAILHIEDNSCESISIVNKAKYENMNNDAIQYRCNGRNLGLSKAYNKALSEMEANNWVMIADDDTYFSMEYLNNAIAELMKQSVELITGIVLYGRGQLSPRLYYKHKLITKPGFYNDVYCINSGLWYKVGLIQELGGYDENLFLDRVDLLLMEKLKIAHKNRVQVVEGKIFQNFDKFSYNTSIEKVQNRYNIWEKDFIYFCKVCKKSRLYLYLKLIQERLFLIYKLLRVRINSTKQEVRSK